ncbi:hypothetical protein BD310DRAFT_940385 [Dichomitus squalens]|uniref:Uncharacterized protein n=1 Tax=Dichomitus squalens TaxID=114155 RepID=A0A4Q9PGP8_9APHY|nr:hypothetical protein BD310DRAFT_940385 [Dichomitus squalens]
MSPRVFRRVRERERARLRWLKLVFSTGLSGNARVTTRSTTTGGRLRARATGELERTSASNGSSSSQSLSPSPSSRRLPPAPGRTGDEMSGESHRTMDSVGDLYPSSCVITSAPSISTSSSTSVYTTSSTSGRTFSFPFSRGDSPDEDPATGCRLSWSWPRP